MKKKARPIPKPSSAHAQALVGALLWRGKGALTAALIVTVDGAADRTGNDARHEGAQARSCLILDVVHTATGNGYQHGDAHEYQRPSAWIGSHQVVSFCHKAFYTTYRMIRGPNKAGGRADSGWSLRLTATR